MNSAERAYQVPYSTDAQACIRPMGSRLSSTIGARPMLIAQKANASGPFFHALPRPQRAQAEEHQAEAEHAVHAEERRVAVHGGRVEALHVVERDGRIDQEAEEARADEIPEGHGDEEVDRPFVGRDPECCRRTGARRMFSQASKPISTSGTTSSALKTAPRPGRRRRAGEVEVMEGADDSAGEEDDGREQHRLALRSGSTAVSCG